MVEIKGVYKGDLLCEVVHGPSGVMLQTDAPVDNNGKGRSFSPTDLLATALGTCMLTVMGIVAQRNHIDLAGTKLVVRKEMTSQPVRRVGTLEVDILVPTNLSDEDRRRLENAADVCPVKRSLHPDVNIRVCFQWGKQV